MEVARFKTELAKAVKSKTSLTIRNKLRLIRMQVVRTKSSCSAARETCLQRKTADGQCINSIRTIMNGNYIEDAHSPNDRTRLRTPGLRSAVIADPHSERSTSPEDQHNMVPKSLKSFP